MLSNLGYWAVSKLGFSATELSKRLGVSQPSVSISVKRGEKIAKTGQLELVEDYNVIILWASLNPDFMDTNHTRFSSHLQNGIFGSV